MTKGILTLQSEYLNGNEQALTQLYIELVKLGKTIIRSEELKLDSDTAYDIASSVIMRLCSLKQPLIKSSPSAFVKRALFFSAHNIQKNHNSKCVDYPINFSTNDEYFADEVCDDLINEILNNIEVPENLMQAVLYCLYTKQPVKAVRVRIRDHEDKRAFTKVMEDIHAYINQKDVCLSMLQWDSYGWTPLLSKAPVQRTRRKRTKVSRPLVTSQQGSPQLLLFSEMETTQRDETKTRTYLPKLRKTASHRSTPCDPTPWLPGIIL